MLLIVGVFIKVLDLFSSMIEFWDKLENNMIYFWKVMIEVGFDIFFGVYLIVLIMLYDVKLF